MDTVSKDTSKAKGFTLLELLIVIAIIAILSVILIIAINPAETLKKARDSQRLSDLNTLKTALGIYLTTITTPDLDTAVATHCLTDTTGATTAVALVSYSAALADTTCANTTNAKLAAGTDKATAAEFGVTDFCRYAGATGGDNVTGTGWVPVDLSTVTGGSPISNLPLDPTNTVSGASGNAPVFTDLVYRYACQQKSTTTGKPSFVFELDATLESAAFGPSGTDDRSAKDGGDQATLYEIGNSVKLMGAGTGY